LEDFPWSPSPGILSQLAELPVNTVKWNSRFIFMDVTRPWPTFEKFQEEMAAEGSGGFFLRSGV